MKTRGFEKITKYADVDFPMPVRKTKTSAGYDICVPETVAILPGRQVLVPTGVKAYMMEDEFLGLHIRSSMAVKKGLRLVNNVYKISAKSHAPGVRAAEIYNKKERPTRVVLFCVVFSP